MVDVRENILARLVALAGGIPNMALVDRNNGQVDDAQLPAIIVFDGDEETNDATDLSQMPPHRPTKVRMHPTIEIAAISQFAGSDLSTMRGELIKAVLYDTELNNNIVRTGRNGNGAIRYLGCQTDPTWMRNKYGQLRVLFMFSYNLDPADL
jgi:hypothetical protein